MMSPDELLSWYQRLEVSEVARAEIDRIRSAGPCRRVGGGRNNVIGRYPSQKMGVTIQFESHQVELAFVREMEHDPDVLELCAGQIYVVAAATLPYWREADRRQDHISNWLRASAGMRSVLISAFAVWGSLEDSAHTARGRVL
jgi:hypothetical protein